MKQYIFLLNAIRNRGEVRTDRTGVGTKSLFGYQMRFDLEAGFPLLTTKKLHWKSIVHELLWMLSGSTNTYHLNKHGVTIWDEWADEHGDLGPVYGKQWRSWETIGQHLDTHRSTARPIDQISDVIEQIKRNPFSRRHIVTAWNPAEVSEMALPPCHCLFQFYVSTDQRLHCQLYQRSADVFLGVPFNIASYALLTHMVAHVTGLKPGSFVHTFGDVHLYMNHMEQAEEQARREPRNLPTVTLNHRVTDIFKFEFEDIQLTGYDPWPAIKAEVAV